MIFYLTTFLRISYGYRLFPNGFPTIRKIPESIKIISQLYIVDETLKKIIKFTFY